MSNGLQKALQAAQAIKAMANIIRGAITAGLHGAAMAAAKSFLSQIIKIAVYTSIGVLLLLITIFSALPNIFFGYDNAISDRVKAMTDQAYALNGIYQNIDIMNDSLAENIVTKIFEDETDNTYDDVQIEKILGNTNEAWIIAITSVLYIQDLNIIDETAVKDILKRKLTHKTAIEFYTIGEGENAQTKIRLKITIEDIDPFALMDKLDFTDEQKNWAILIHNTITEGQEMDILGTDYLASYGINYGDISFTDSIVPVEYFNQADSRWGSKSYGKSGTIASSGCGPTALAIVISSLTDTIVKPDEVASWSAKNGYRVEYVGSSHALIPDGAKNWGLSVEGAGIKEGQKIVDALAEGKLVIAIMTKGHFTKGGHFIVLRGVTSDGKILVADPISLKRSNQEWALSLILNEASKKAGAGDPFWIVSSEGSDSYFKIETTSTKNKS